jgi:hypothetical protein
MCETARQRVDDEEEPIDGQTGTRIIVVLVIISYTTVFYYYLFA